MMGLTRSPASANINLPSALADWPQLKKLFRSIDQLNLIEFQVIKQPVRRRDLLCPDVRTNKGRVNWNQITWQSNFQSSEK